MSATLAYPTMTSTALRAKIAEVARLINLGTLLTRNFRASSWYADYAAFSFAGYFGPDEVATVRGHMKAFCAAHGWTEINVQHMERAYEISVIMHKAQHIAIGDARLPD